MYTQMYTQMCIKKMLKKTSFLNFSFINKKKKKKIFESKNKICKRNKNIWTNKKK